MRAMSTGFRLWHLQFVLLAAIWGLSFVFIKIGDGGLAPLQVALGRMVFGSAVLIAVLAVRRESLPRDPRTWGHLAVAALLLNAVPFSLFAYGELRVSSVMAGIWNATTPLLTLPVAMLVLRDERLTRARAAGLAVGFAGVLVVLGIWRGFGGGDTAGSLLCLAAGGSYALGFPYARRNLAGRPESALALSAAQLLCGTAELALITPFLTGPPTAVTPQVVASVIALGALGTGIAYVLSYSIIRDAGATVASTVTYLIPVFFTVAGVLLLHEPLSWNQPIGALIVIAGAALSHGSLGITRPRPRRGRPAPQPRDGVNPAGPDPACAGAGDKGCSRGRASPPAP